MDHQILIMVKTTMTTEGVEVPKLEYRWDENEKGLT